MSNLLKDASVTASVVALAALAPLAVEIGKAWVHELVGALRSDDRDVIGAWPGTLREARMRVLARIDAKLDATQLDDLARQVNLSARRGWREVAGPDLEP